MGRERRTRNDGIHAQLRSLAVPINSITLDPDNARSHDERSHEAIAESYREHGQRKPVIVRRATNVVIAGNGQLQAARDLGWTHIAAIFVDDDQAEATRFALRDNRTAELSVWDGDVVADALQSLQAQDVDISNLGWSDVELTSYLDVEIDPGPDDGDFPAQGEAIPPSSIDDDPSLDEIPEHIEPTSKPGDQIRIGTHQLHVADCIEFMREQPEGSVDSIVTDPPYGIGFMGKDWDGAVPGDEWAAECFRLLKPGGHLIAFAANRTIHRLTVALEDAGFEVRDQIGWVTWQGFPKSLDVSKAIDKAAGAEREVVGQQAVTRMMRGSGDLVGGNVLAGSIPITAPATDAAKQWDGWGTALKPAIEPAILVRKPLDGTVADNVQKHGVGGLNIDGCRYAYGDPAWPGPQENNDTRRNAAGGDNGLGGTDTFRIRERRAEEQPERDGRFPANLYVCPKPSRSEREAGTDDVAKRPGGSNAKGYSADVARGLDRNRPVGNSHPTVKPVRLMRWLCRLVTPPGGTVLEPFLGSGTTAIAAHAEGFTCIACEREPKYMDIATARLRANI